MRLNLVKYQTVTFSKLCLAISYDVAKQSLALLVQRQYLFIL